MKRVSRQTVDMHQCCPKEWRKTPVVMGDYDLDETLFHRNNKDLPNRLALYVTQGKAYGPLTGYSGYHGYHGDN